MPRVTVKFFATVREVTGVRSIEIDAETIRDVLEDLKRRYGKQFLETVIDQNTGELRRFYSFMVNGKRVELLDGYDTRLSEGDSVALFPPIGGG